MKKCVVTNKESGCKYTLFFKLNETPMAANGYEYGTENFVYSEEAHENETSENFIKRVKKDVQMHEDL